MHSQIGFPTGFPLPYAYYIGVIVFCKENRAEQGGNVLLDSDFSGDARVMLVPVGSFANHNNLGLSCFERLEGEMRLALRELNERGKWSK